MRTSSHGSIIQLKYSILFTHTHTHRVNPLKSTYKQDPHAAVGWLNSLVPSWRIPLLFLFLFPSCCFFSPFPHFHSMATQFKTLLCPHFLWPPPRNFHLDHFFFNWRIIAFQNFVVFCQTLTWIRHRYIYIYPLPPHPTPLGRYRVPVWVSWATQQISLALCLIYGDVSFHAILSIHLTLSSPSPCS